MNDATRAAGVANAPLRVNGDQGSHGVSRSFSVLIRRSLIALGGFLVLLLTFGLFSIRDSRASLTSAAHAPFDTLISTESTVEALDLRSGEMSRILSLSRRGAEQIRLVHVERRRLLIHRKVGDDNFLDEIDESGKRMTLRSYLYRDGRDLISFVYPFAVTEFRGDRRLEVSRLDRDESWQVIPDDFVVASLVFKDELYLWSKRALYHVSPTKITSIVTDLDSARVEATTNGVWSIRERYTSRHENDVTEVRRLLPPGKSFVVPGNVVSLAELDGRLVAGTIRVCDVRSGGFLELDERGAIVSRLDSSVVYEPSVMTTIRGEILVGDDGCSAVEKRLLRLRARPLRVVDSRVTDRTILSIMQAAQ